MKEKLKQNNRLAKTFSYTFCYIDDLLTVNNPNFRNEIGNICPPQLHLKKPQKMLSYLDLELSIVDSMFRICIRSEKEKVCQKWSTVHSHGYAYCLPKNCIANLDVATRNFICSTNLSSVTLRSHVDAAFDQYAVPSLFITRYILILYASLISWPILSRSRLWGICYTHIFIAT